MRNITWAAGAALLLAIAPAHAQDVTLKVHHFLPAGSAANTMFISPGATKSPRTRAAR